MARSVRRGTFMRILSIAAVATLAAHVTEQIGTAVLLERTIVERLKAGG